MPSSLCQGNFSAYSPGVSSGPGAGIGAFIIGLCENLIKSTEYTVFSDAFTFALLIVILVFKPTGLFGEKSTDKV